MIKVIGIGARGKVLNLLPKSSVRTECIVYPIQPSARLRRRVPAPRTLRAPYNIRGPILIDALLEAKGRLVRLRALLGGTAWLAVSIATPVSSFLVRDGCANPYRPNLVRRVISVRRDRVHRFNVGLGFVVLMTVMKTIGVSGIFVPQGNILPQADKFIALVALLENTRRITVTRVTTVLRDVIFVHLERSLPPMTILQIAKPAPKAHTTRSLAGGMGALTVRHRHTDPK